MWECTNLIEVHEAIGSLDKLRRWSLMDCKKLKILPSTLRLKSLRVFHTRGCKSLDKFPNIHPEMEWGNIYRKWECGPILALSDSNITEWPLSLRYLLSGVRELYLENGGFLASFSRYEFTNLMHLKFSNCDRYIIESNFWPRLESFPSLIRLDLSESSIVTIPRTISRLTRLHFLWVKNCKKLREISRLPPSIRFVDATNCMSLNLPSSCRLLNQVSSLYINN